VFLYKAYTVQRVKLRTKIIPTLERKEVHYFALNGAHELI